ncbi:MAG: DUF58 domain-containing protein [Lachnospiraceae bacterium]|nr:DUF58 domain-containing protein [Lachnospiraceae bacterium]
MKRALTYIRYLVFLSLIVLLYFFNNHPVFLLAVFALILAPVISIVMFFACSNKIRFSIDNRSDVLNREEGTSFCLCADNRSIYPFVKAVFNCTISNNLNPNTVEHLYDLYVAPKEKMRYEIPVSYMNCGNYAVSLKQVTLRDLFGFVSKTCQVDTTTEVIVLPLEIDLDDSIEGTGGTPNDETVYERNEKGSDPSEIFEIREYRMGDRPQQIHWKLSAKQRELMAKEFSDVVGEAFEIFLCNDYSDNHQMDAYYDVMFSLGVYFARKGIFFSYSWYSEENATIEKMAINSEEKVSEALLAMYYSQSRHNNRTAFQLLSSIPEELRHVMVLTSQSFPMKDQARQLFNLNNLVRLYAI